MGGCSCKRGRQAPAMAPEGTLWFSRPGEQSCSMGHPRMWPGQLPLRRRASLGGGLPPGTMACPSGITDPASWPWVHWGGVMAKKSLMAVVTCPLLRQPGSRRGSMWFVHCIFKICPSLPPLSLPPAQKQALTVGMSEIIGF